MPSESPKVTAERARNEAKAGLENVRGVTAIVAPHGFDGRWAVCVEWPKRGTWRLYNSRRYPQRKDGTFNVAGIRATLERAIEETKEGGTDAECH